MTLQELRYLVALADHGHFGRAAEACHVSQPTLSSQLKKLEGDLGVVLFERTSKILHVTPLGQKIVDQARRVLAETDVIIALAREPSPPLAGPLSLGVIPTLGPYLLPWLVPQLKRAAPRLRLTLCEDLTDGLIARLRAHRVDAALLALPIAGRDLEIRPLFDEPFCFACPADHPLAKCDHVRDEDLRRTKLLLLTDGHCLREQALAVCGQRDALLENADADMRATSLETLRQMVAAGMGCTLLPAMAVAGAKDGLFAVRPLACCASRRIGLIGRRTDPNRADLEHLAEIIREALPAAVSPVAER